MQCFSHSLRIQKTKVPVEVFDKVLCLIYSGVHQDIVLDIVIIIFININILIVLVMSLFQLASIFIMDY